MNSSTKYAGFGFAAGIAISLTLVLSPCGDKLMAQPLAFFLALLVPATLLSLFGFVTAEFAVKMREESACRLGPILSSLNEPARLLDLLLVREEDREQLKDLESRLWWFRKERNLQGKSVGLTLLSEWWKYAYFLSEVCDGKLGRLLVKIVVVSVAVLGAIAALVGWCT